MKACSAPGPRSSRSPRVARMSLRGHGWVEADRGPESVESLHHPKRVRRVRRVRVTMPRSRVFGRRGIVCSRCHVTTSTHQRDDPAPPRSKERLTGLLAGGEEGRRAGGQVGRWAGGQEGRWAGGQGQAAGRGAGSQQWASRGTCRRRHTAHGPRPTDHGDTRPRRSARVEHPAPLSAAQRVALRRPAAPGTRSNRAEDARCPAPTTLFREAPSE